MKIPSSFQLAYDSVFPQLELIKNYVDPRMQEIAKVYKAAYSSRIKLADSMLLKIEKGPYSDPLSELDDMFACTITVHSLPLIKEVLARVEEEFEIVTKNQRKLKYNEFDYNDLNLILKIKPSFHNKDQVYIKYPFELQIKTLLQEAWAKAGHNIIYKGRNRTYSLQRLASQLRALLEMADSFLANLESSASLLHFQTESEPENKTGKIVDLLEMYWNSEALPSDTNRAALIINDYMNLGGLNLEELQTLLEDSQNQKFLQAKSITPTQAIFIIIFQEKKGDLLGKLRNRKLFITSEMIDLFPGLSRIKAENRINYSSQNFL